MQGKGAQQALRELELLLFESNLKHRSDWPDILANIDILQLAVDDLCSRERTDTLIDEIRHSEDL